MNDKYELLLDEFVEIFGTKLFRIKAKAPFSAVSSGKRGGFIESEKNLAQVGDAWVSGDAKVFGNARVSGNAEVRQSSDILVIGPVGSRDAYFTVTISNEMAAVGCFHGSLDELEAAAKEKGRQDYLDLLPGIRAIVARRKHERKECM